MSPATHTNTSDASAAAVGTGIRWNSPMPYLFGGLAVMLGLIAVALLILGCTQDTRSHDEEENCAAASRKSSQAVDDGPKFVVVMAGDHVPTFFAKPMPPAPPASKLQPLQCPLVGSVEQV